MKKGLIIGVIILLILAGGFLFFRGGKKPAETQSGEKKTEQSAPNDNNNVILDTVDKIKSAMLGGQKLECTYTSKEAGKTMSDIHFFSEGKKYRSDYTLNGEKFISISDGETIYNWSDKTKKGTKMAVNCIKDLSADVPQIKDMADQQTAEDVVDNSMNVSCKPAVAVDFSIPSDVVLEDQCEMFRKQMDTLKELKGKIPANINIPGAQ